MEYIGKTLDELLEAEKDNTTKFYIGSLSSYFCIGTASEINEMIDGISNKYFRDFKNAFETLRKDSERLLDSVTKRKNEELTSYAERLSGIAEKLKTNEICLRRAEKKLESFEPMRNRKIVDAYKKKIYGGMAIILSGEESGSFWTLEEWEKANERL